ncbi:hypothetical protein ACEPAH_9195 [Sanghuangporus vaninii]
MQAKQAARRLQHVQRTLVESGPDPVPKRARVLILPDDSNVYVSDQSAAGKILISIDSREVLAYSIRDHTAKLLLSAVGTSFEKDNPNPEYPILELCGPRQGDQVDFSPSDIWSCIYVLWTLYHAQEHIPFVFAASVPNATTITSYLLQSGLARYALDPNETAMFLLRATFWQGAGTGPVWSNARGWLRYTPNYNAFPQVQSFTRTSAVIAQHPLRPPKPPFGTVIYKRFCVEIGRVLTFHVINPDDAADMNAFHCWMNDERVNSGWGERGDMLKHRSYVLKTLNDLASLPLIMSWDGERMGYCEMVWTKENHLAPYVPFGVRDYDRGMHVLVGEDKFRGRTYSKTWFRAIMHYIFLAEPRTERMLGEPKNSNGVAVGLGQECGMHTETTFYFPYKHSRLEAGLRECFFKEDMLL